MALEFLSRSLHAFPPTLGHNYHRACPPKVHRCCRQCLRPPLSVPFNLFCQLVRHSASVRRALLHFFFFFFLLIVVAAAAEMSPLFLGLFSTFSLRLFGLLRHFERGSAPSVCARARCSRPPVVCPSAQPLPPAIIRLASRTLSYRCFPVFNSCSPLPPLHPGGHSPGPLHQIAYHFDDGTDNIKGLTDSKEGGRKVGIPQKLTCIPRLRRVSLHASRFEVFLSFPLFVQLSKVAGDHMSN